jgi:phospholipase C
VKEFDGAIYHLRVYGPNGFHREFRGNAGEPRLKVNLLQPQIRERPNGLVELALSNLSPRESYTVAVVDLSYGTPASTREIRPGERLVLRAGSPSTKGWYDLAVTVQGSENFLRRYAGRVETGEASISDPLMGRATT